MADALDLAYCDACKASWRAIGGWCSAEDREAWFEVRGLLVRVRCSAIKEGTGERCKVTSLQAHEGAEPLRRGADRCAAHGGVAVGAARISQADLIAGQQQVRNVVLERARSGRVLNHGACRELPLGA